MCFIFITMCKTPLTTLLLLIAALALRAQTYVGEIQYNHAYEYVKIACNNDTCLFSLPYYLPDNKKVISPTALHSGTTAFRYGLDEITLNTTVKEGHVTGTITISGHQQSLQLQEQQAPIAAGKLPQYIGVYASEGNQRIIVYERYGYLHLVSPFSQETNSLKPIAAHTFWSVTNETTTFSKAVNGQFQQVSLQTRGGSKHAFSRIPSPTVQELYIPVGNDTLYAQLFMPQTNKKVPACLILPGGGAIGMDNYVYEARYLSSYGIASLIFDKPGNGKSKGESNFRWQNFGQKSEQYQQLFNYLRNHAAIDANKVGIHGPSEGGRLALLMAIDLQEKVAFVNAVAAPIMTLREGQFYAMDHHHRNMGVDEIDNMKIRQIWADYYDGIVAGNIDSAVVDRALQYLEGHPGLFLPASHAFPASPRAEDIDNNRVVKEVGNITCPILMQYGENDQRVHPTKSLRNFRANYTKHFDAIIYRRGNHSFMTPEYKICPGYLDDKVKWLKRINIL